MESEPPPFKSVTWTGLIAAPLGPLEVSSPTQASEGCHYLFCTFTPPWRKKPPAKGKGT